MPPSKTHYAVAQRLMVGFSGTTITPDLQRFLSLGVGGVILFRENFKDAETHKDASFVKRLIADIHAAVPKGLPKPFIAIDQEGGAVERLSESIFPSLPSPYAVAQHPHPLNFAQQVYQPLAEQLASLGITMNFCPTLDLNTNPKNRVIGVRSFGSEPQKVAELGQVTITAHQQAGVVPVIKHFPGHGSGEADSHETLPTVNYTDQEAWAFQHAIQQKAPAVLVSHGYYPQLQTHYGPASLSAEVIQTLLREELHFEGVVISDDMNMGAITKEYPLEEAALKALQAGVDLLVFRTENDTTWQVFESLCAATDAKQLEHKASLNRLQQLKETLSSCPQNSSPNPVDSSSLLQAGIECLSSNRPRLNPHQAIWMIHPNREQMGNYALDIPWAEEFPGIFKANGFDTVVAYRYNLNETPNARSFHTFAHTASRPQAILVVSWCPRSGSISEAWVAAMRKQHPNTPLILVSAGWADSETWVKQQDIFHVGLYSYRPAAQAALVEWLLQAK